MSALPGKHQMDVYKLASVDKKVLARKIGQDLIQHDGKRPHHEFGDIKARCDA